MIPKADKTFIRICIMCGNTFETDCEMRKNLCQFCSGRPIKHIQKAIDRFQKVYQNEIEKYKKNKKQG